MYRFFSFVLRLDLLHRLVCQPFAVGCLFVERCHGGASPSKDRVEWCDRGAILCRSRCADLAAAMCGAIVQASDHARLFECVAEAFFFERIAVLTADESEVANRARIKRPPKDGRDREAHRYVALENLAGLQSDCRRCADKIPSPPPWCKEVRDRPCPCLL